MGLGWCLIPAHPSGTEWSELPTVRLARLEGGAGRRVAGLTSEEGDLGYSFIVAGKDHPLPYNFPPQDPCEGAGLLRRRARL